MANGTSSPLFCRDVGRSPASGLDCCYADQQNTRICHEIFADAGVFAHSCSNNCIDDCSDTEHIYASKLQDVGLQGTGTEPISRYLTCANVPNMAHHLSQGSLEQNLSSEIAKFIPHNAQRNDLRHVTFAVTDCLTATCRNSRRPGLCKFECSGVNLLSESATPNMTGLDECLKTLCLGGQNSLPFADADVVGIGVFSSYVMQCAFVVILWFLFTWFETFIQQRKADSNPGSISDSLKQEELPNGQTSGGEGHSSMHQSRFEDFLEEFHKAQCYFSTTIQIAALTYGIFDMDMLITFMLIPLATNGVLPIAFILVLLYRCDRSGVDVILLTIVCWVLSSVVFWTLYSHIIPINSEIASTDREYRAYRQFYYKLSSLDACGGYSALAVCPNNFRLGQGEIIQASHKIRALTPVIWTFSTICLLAVVGARLFGLSLSHVRLFDKKANVATRPAQKTTRIRPNESEENGLNSQSNNEAHPQHDLQQREARQHRNVRYLALNNLIYALVTLCFLAGIGMQLSLLSIATSLRMMNRTHWTFGQVVAITIWIPPMITYLYKEASRLPGKFKRAQHNRKISTTTEMQPMISKQFGRTE